MLQCLWAKDFVENVGSPRPRRYRSPRTTPSASGSTPKKTCVLNRYFADHKASAVDEVTSFSLEAGRRSTSGRSRYT